MIIIDCEYEYINSDTNKSSIDIKDACQILKVAYRRKNNLFFSLFYIVFGCGAICWLLGICLHPATTFKVISVFACISFALVAVVTFRWNKEFYEKRRNISKRIHPDNVTIEEVICVRCYSRSANSEYTDYIVVFDNNYYVDDYRIYEETQKNDKLFIIYLTLSENSKPCVVGIYKARN